MEIRFKVSDRKELVKAIGEIIGIKPQHMYAPTMAYRIGEFTVDREGVISCEDEKAAGVLRDQLLEMGYEVADRFTVTLPEKYAQGDTIENIRKIVEGRKSLFSSAFQSEDITIEACDGDISFPWFRQIDEDHAEAYSIFIEKLAQMAARQSLVSMKNRAVENEKYAMRCLLLRMGMIGHEYKKTR